jgi:hypothetical protein
LSRHFVGEIDVSHVLAILHDAHDAGLKTMCVTNWYTGGHQGWSAPQSDDAVPRRFDHVFLSSHRQSPPWIRQC